VTGGAGWYAAKITNSNPITGVSTAGEQSVITFSATTGTPISRFAPTATDTGTVIYLGNAANEITGTEDDGGGYYNVPGQVVGGDVVTYHNVRGVGADSICQKLAGGGDTTGTLVTTAWSMMHHKKIPFRSGICISYRKFSDQNSMNAYTIKCYAGGVFYTNDLLDGNVTLAAKYPTTYGGEIWSASAADGWITHNGGGLVWANVNPTAGDSTLGGWANLTNSSSNAQQYFQYSSTGGTVSVNVKPESV
jgi:hypothetical protein